MPQRLERGAAYPTVGAVLSGRFFATLAATIEFVTLEPGRTYEVAGLSVTSIKQFTPEILMATAFPGWQVDSLLY